MLDTYLTEQTPVTVTLQNKVRVSGRISAFDSYVIVMEGHKREIVYRHAVSCLSRLMQETQNRRPEMNKPAAVKAASPRPAKVASHKPLQAQPHSPSSSATGSLNNSMKDGLLKWMQEQKAVK